MTADRLKNLKPLSKQPEHIPRMPMSIGLFTLNIFGKNRECNEEFIALFSNIDDAIITGILMSKNNEIIKIYDEDGILIEEIEGKNI